MSEDVTKDQGAPGLRRWARVLLAVSLAVNLMILGLVVGSHVFDGKDRREGRDGVPREMSQRDGRDRHGEGRLDPAFGPLGRALAGEHRRAAGEALAARGGAPEVNRRQVAQELGQMIETLRAEPFDGAQMNAILQAQHDRFTQRNAMGREILVERLEDMSQEDRAAFADRLERGFRRAMERERR